MAKSIYKQCAEAIDRLVKKPPKQHGGVFTEIDVTTEAATGDWKSNDFTRSLHDSNAICGTQYRHRKLCRYGPVTLADGKTQDYARIAGKIVYADAETGPEIWKTPNGDFPRMMIEDDELTKQGRRPGTERNDAHPWDDQPLSAKPRKPARRRKMGSTSNKGLENLVFRLAERVETLEEAEKERQNYIREQAKRQGILV